MSSNEEMQRVVQFDTGQLKIEDIVDLALHAARPVLSESSEFHATIARGAAFVTRVMREGRVIYGVTTGYGDSCTVTVDMSLAAELPQHLYTYHGCGLGQPFSREQTRAIV